MADLKKVLMVFTGGSISTRLSKKALELGVAPYAVLDAAGKFGKDFTIIEPVDVCSENFTPPMYKVLFDALKKEGMTSVIVDLRDNGGGLLSAVTDMLDYLLPEGVLTYTENKNGKREYYESDKFAALDVPTDLIEGGLTCVNPTPIDVDLGDCYVDNYTGATSVDVEVQTLDEFGATDKSYIWKDVTFLGTKYYGWYLDGELDGAYDDLDDDDKVTIKPGQGIWVLSSAEQDFQFVWPKVDL